MTVVVQYESERALCYRPEGGTCFQCFVKGIGWVIDEEPSAFIEALARCVHEELLLRQGRDSANLARV